MIWAIQEVSSCGMQLAASFHLLPCWQVARANMMLPANLKNTRSEKGKLEGRRCEMKILDVHSLKR